MTWDISKRDMIEFFVLLEKGKTTNQLKEMFKLSHVTVNRMKKEGRQATLERFFIPCVVCGKVPELATTRKFCGDKHQYFYSKCKKNEKIAIIKKQKEEQETKEKYKSYDPKDAEKFGSIKKYKRFLKIQECNRVINNFFKNK